MTQGKFVWFDLFSTDPVKARAFYSETLGWKVNETEMPMGTYHMFMAGEKGIGGSSELPEQAKAMGAPSHWLAYITTDDVDATCEKIKALGGQLLMPPMDIPTVGRFAIAMDPQGAMFSPFKGASDEGASDDSAEPGVGEFCWHELMTTDAEAGLSFYKQVFGWSDGEAMDTPEGKYQMFNRGEKTQGGVMNLPPKAAEMGAKSHWLNYTVVEDVEQAITRVKNHGGQVVHGPMPVPGGQVAIMVDPTGATFAVWNGEAKSP